MDEQTVGFYDRHAAEVAARYESADMSHVYHLLDRYLPEGAAILEIGGGTGRDAAYLLSRGHDVTSLDASQAMVDRALALHPELSGRIHHAAVPLPDNAPLLEKRHQAVLCLAVLMHVPDQDLFGLAYQVRRSLDEGGTLIVSTSTDRAGLREQRDSQGRLFRERPPEEIRTLFERLGMRYVARHELPDALGRELLWHFLVFRLENEAASRSVDQVESIIRQDKKDATYKLALLRALCDLARTESHRARWRPDGRVAVPLGLIAERWLLYYWPLVEPDRDERRVVIPQKRGLELNKPIAFRAPLLDLITSYPRDSLATFHRDFRARTLPAEVAARADAAMNAISRTIVVGPVEYTGGSLDLGGSFFGCEGHRTARGRCSTPEGAALALGHVLVPGPVWRELCTIGHWISESIIVRWAELTSEMSEGRVKASEVIERLLAPTSTERDVHDARTIYLGLPGVSCVWTDRPVGATTLAVDHLIPFSLWENNDLWNLLPAAAAVNTAKSDRLVSYDTLMRRRDAIVHYWEIMLEVRPERFGREVGRALTGDTVVPRGDWQANAFARLVEYVETLALQRGVQRWSPPS